MTLDIIKQSLDHYLPKFIVRNDVLQELLTRFGTALLSVRTAVDDLVMVRTSGTTGHKFGDDVKLLMAKTEDDATLQAALAGGVVIHKVRGTQAGVLADVKRITGDSSATTVHYTKEECGWWLGVTYPGIVPGTDIYDDSLALSYLGLKRFLRIVYQNKSKRTDDELQTVIHQEIVPAVISSNTELQSLRHSGQKWIKFKNMWI